MIRFFLPLCEDRSTLTELDAMAADERKWIDAHTLFRKIRTKQLDADNALDKLRQCQYSFEEICAKTLYNMSGHLKGTDESPYPFDDDSPFWVVPNALQFAYALGVAEPLRICSLLRPHTAE